MPPQVLAAPVQLLRVLGIFVVCAILAIKAMHSNASEVVDTNPDQIDGNENADVAAMAGPTEVEQNPEAIEALPEAENVDLSDPILPEPEPEPQPKPESSTLAPTAPPEQKEAVTEPEALKPEESAPTAPAVAVEQPFVLLQKKIAKGTTTRLSWSPDQSFEGIATPTPVLVAHGQKPGPKLCLTAAVHGDELNGIEVVRSIMYDIDPKELAGTVIGVPIVNLQGFRRSSRYLSDRRDLNRFFPGNPNGSSASRIAHSFFESVIRHCDFLVDLHTGSFYRTNLPQLRANLKNERVMELTKAFDAIAVLHSEGALGTLRRAAVDIGIPAVTLEAGGPLELNEDYVEQGTKAVNTLLDKMGMLDTMTFWGTPQPAYYRSIWVRADQGGILFSEVKLGAKVRKGDLLGKVTDPITNIRKLIFSPVNGRLLGMAINQVVLPGFAAFHIGIEPSKPSSEVTAIDDEEDVSVQDNDEEEEEEAGFDEFD